MVKKCLYLGVMSFVSKKGNNCNKVRLALEDKFGYRPCESFVSVETAEYFKKFKILDQVDARVYFLENNSVIIDRP